MEHNGSDLTGGSEVADKGGGEFIGEEIAANIRFSRCNLVYAFGHEGLVTAIVDGGGELPGGALYGDSTYMLLRLVRAGAAEQQDETGDEG